MGYYVPQGELLFCTLDAPPSDIHVQEHQTYYLHDIGSNIPLHRSFYDHPLGHFN